MYREDTNIGLCNQTLYDEDFSSAYSRMPHIIKLLSPWYVTGSYPTMASDVNNLVENPDMDGSNWNFLFSNRVQGLGVAPTTMNVHETIGKSIEGYTITPAQFVESRQGSQIDLTFTDTKNLEVFEMARLWMLYMYKRQKGIFLPPYNGYARSNDFKFNGEKLQGPLSGTQFTRMHPYDRAIEYGASMYDIITNETGTKILYWCKYYGIYPIAAAPTLDNSQNQPITSVTTTISFKYHYRLENNNKTLVEFNHDAGLTTDIGKLYKTQVSESLPFLYRDEKNMKNGNPILPQYLGAAGMFTGSPFIVMEQTRKDPLGGGMILTPELRFMSVPDMYLDNKLNLGITDKTTRDISRNVVAYTSLVEDAKQDINKSASAVINAYNEVASRFSNTL